MGAIIYYSLTVYPDYKKLVIKCLLLYTRKLFLFKLSADIVSQYKMFNNICRSGICKRGCCCCAVDVCHRCGYCSMSQKVRGHKKATYDLCDVDIMLCIVNYYDIDLLH